MNFDKNVLDYLEGKSFSSGLEVSISHPEKTIPNRFNLLEDMVQGKRIIHIGCVDHLSLIDRKIQQNLWLHARLCQKAERCLGVDINQEGIDYLRNIKGYMDVVCADITHDEINDIKDNKWDYMLLGEILEHVENPCYFLSALKIKYSDVIDRLIITVPNAFSFLNIRYMFKHKECINSDHKYWFTPYTLAKIATISKMNIEKFEFCEPAPTNEKGISNIINLRFVYRQYLLKRYPATRETLLMVLKL
jgi:hypothetical protein